MAIYPIHNIYISNFVDTISGVFKSGSCLMKNQNGYAVIADRSNPNFNVLNDGLGKFIGFAANDHDSINTILNNDPVGSSYLDSSGRLIDNVNGFFAGRKRSISEFSDEGISKYYNTSEVLISSRRGVGVYNLQGEIFATDQFALVMAELIDSDGSTAITFSQGDLLTYGAGVNSGKLVKVDTSGIGPSVLVVGVVEKYDAGSGVLYFRHILEPYRSSVSLFTSGITLFLDASNPSSYSGSGVTWYDLSGNGLNAQLQNGVQWLDENGGTMAFDGTNDQAVVPDNSLLDFPSDFTIEGAVIKQVGGGGWLHRRSSDAERNWVLSANSGNSMWFLIRFSGAWYPATLDTWGGENLFTKYNHVVVTRNSGVINCYYNGTLRFTFNNNFNLDTSTGFVIGSWDSFGLWSKLKTPYVRLYSQGMSADQVRQNYNASMGRLL